jgi:acyl carrier protein
MTEQEVKDIVIAIINDIAPDEDTSNLDGAVRLREQLDLDSMDFLDIVMELRKRYKVEVPEDEYMQLATLDGCVSYLKPKLEAAAA